MPAQLARPTSGERRYGPRREVSLAARVRAPKSPWLACTVRNISAMGALLEFAQTAMLSESLILQVPELLLELECSVCHCDGRSAGVQFTSNRQATLALLG